MLNECYENENKIFEKIQGFCNEYIIDNNIEKGIKEIKFNNCGYLYLLNNSKDEILFSPIKLNSVTEEDFEEDNNFLENDTKIGYGTLIESGVWILFKEDEVRYTIKDNEKKIAVIKLKKEKEGYVLPRYFSYSTKIERSIGNNIENCNSLIELINTIEFEYDIYTEKESIGNKSLRFLIDDLEAKINEINELEVEATINKSELEVKLEEISSKYKSISKDIELEFKNIKLTMEKQEIKKQEELSLIVVDSESKSLISYVLKAFTNLFKFNLASVKNNFISINGGKNE